MYKALSKNMLRLNGLLVYLFNCIYNRYHELDVHKSLRDNLSYKTLIEYPVLHVVLRNHWKEYPLKGPGKC